MPPERLIAPFALIVTVTEREELLAVIAALLIVNCSAIEGEVAAVSASIPPDGTAITPINAPALIVTPAPVKLAVVPAGVYVMTIKPPPPVPPMPVVPVLRKRPAEPPPPP